MRVNIYHEEIMREVQVVSKTVEDTGRTFYGVRFMLKSPDALHNTPGDDDRSAVTFWGGTPVLCRDLLQMGIDALNDHMEEAAHTKMRRDAEAESAH